MTEGPGSFAVLEASYIGCYVTAWDSQHIMSVGVEGVDAARHRTVAETRLFKCPMGLPALSVLGVDLGDSVPVWDRLPCVPSLTTQEDYKMLGIPLTMETQWQSEFQSEGSRLGLRKGRWENENLDIHQSVLLLTAYEAKMVRVTLLASIVYYNIG